MDSISQAVLGAAIGEVVLGKKIGNKGAILGAVIATIPDLDIILLPFYSAVEKISIHRGFSHSILFSVIGAFIFSWILTKVKWTNQISFIRLLIFTWLALFTHILLDAFTSYGTQMLLPFSNYRVSFDSINIVDPIYTVPLIIGVILSTKFFKQRTNRSFYSKIGLLISSVYLLFTLFVKEYVSNEFSEQLQNENIEYNSLLTVPVGVGSVNWFCVAKTDSSLLIGKFSNLEQNNIDFARIPINDHLLNGLNTELVKTLKWFSKDYYSVAESEGKVRLYNMQCDMQGVRTFGDYTAPTAFYFEIIPQLNGNFELSTGMHKRDKE